VVLKWDVFQDDCTSAWSAASLAAAAAGLVGRVGPCRGVWASEILGCELSCDALAVRGVDVEDLEARQEIRHVNLGRA